MRLIFPLLLATAFSVQAAPSPFALEIDLTAQKVSLLQDGKIVYESPISSGRPGHRTPTGTFQITEKSPDHRSSLYGKIVDANGKTLLWDADSDMPVPPGAKFVNAPMKNFLRYDGATGLHEGYLPGYPASHGCIRLSPIKAELFFNIVEIGTPVHVFGVPPETTPPEKPQLAAKPAPTPTPAPEPRKWYQIVRRVQPKPASAR